VYLMGQSSAPATRTKLTAVVRRGKGHLLHLPLLPIWLERHEHKGHALHSAYYGWNLRTFDAELLSSFAPKLRGPIRLKPTAVT